MSALRTLRSRPWSLRSAAVLLLAANAGLPCHASPWRPPFPNKPLLSRRAVKSGPAEPAIVNASEQHWGSGSDSLSFTRDSSLPSRSWVTEAEERLWARARHAVRRGQLQPSEQYSETLDRLAPGLDTENFQPPPDSGFWESMCASVQKDEKIDADKVTTVCSTTDGSSGSSSYPCRCGSSGAICTASEELCFAKDGLCKAVQPLDGYTMVTKKTCAVEDLLDTPPLLSELEAYLACDGSCSAIVDVGCDRSVFRLCKMGVVPEDSSSSCLRLRVPDHGPPEGEPRAPVQKKFWKAFCSQKGTHNFRLLFEGRLCSGPTIDLGDSWTPDRCAEMAAANPACTEIFDFKKGQPTVCRCLQTGVDCAAPAPTGPLDKTTNVFLRAR